MSIHLATFKIYSSYFTLKIKGCIYIRFSFIAHYTVPTSHSEVTVVQSDDNQPRQDYESSQIEHTGLCICTCMEYLFCACYTEVVIIIG